MRTTVELPPELMRKAKAIAAERGESLKTLLTRAVSAEVGKSKGRLEPPARVRLPLFGSAGKEPIDVTNSDVARALSADDAGTVGRRQIRRRR